VERPEKPVPVRARRCGITTATREPHAAPLTPGLRKENQTYAIGFTARLSADEYE
jgi:hypothetical protein